MKTRTWSKVTIKVLLRLFKIILSQRLEAAVSSVFQFFSSHCGPEYDLKSLCGPNKRLEHQEPFIGVWKKLSCHFQSLLKTFYEDYNMI